VQVERRPEQILWTVAIYACARRSSMDER
jgi:hypothetical protein